MRDQHKKIHYFLPPFLNKMHIVVVVEPRHFCWSVSFRILCWCCCSCSLIDKVISCSTMALLSSRPRTMRRDGLGQRLSSLLILQVGGAAIHADDSSSDYLRGSSALQYFNYLPTGSLVRHSYETVGGRAQPDGRRSFAHQPQRFIGTALLLDSSKTGSSSNTRSRPTEVQDTNRVTLLGITSIVDREWT